MSDAQVKRIKADELTPDIRNANKGTERGRYALETSLREYGAGRSIVIDKAGRIIAGNKTLETAAEMGLDDVLVVQTDGTQIVAVQRMDLDLAQDDKARMLAYADNRVGQLDLDFDAEVLAEDLAAGLDLSAFWQEFELDEIIAELQPETTPGEDTEPQIDRAEELRQKWNVETGQLWQLGEHRLICGDCTDAEVVARVMGEEKASLVFSDPPYNYASENDIYAANVSKAMNGLKSAEWDKDFDLRPALDVLPIAQDVTVYLCSSHHLAPVIWEWMKTWADYFGWCVWSKPNPMPSLLKRRWTWNAELIPYATRGKHVFNFPDNGHALCVWTINKEKETDHPTEKPVEVPSHAIRHSSNNNDIVFDGFSGSGTTIIACENLKRRCRAVEISPGYVAVALERWHQHTGKMPELIEA